MFSDSSDPDIALVVGFGAGLYWFFKGFRVYREYRVLLDTPEIPIGSTITCGTTFAMAGLNFFPKARAGLPRHGPAAAPPSATWRIADGFGWW